MTPAPARESPRPTSSASSARPRAKRSRRWTKADAVGCGPLGHGAASALAEADIVVERRSDGRWHLPRAVERVTRRCGRAFGARGFAAGFFSGSTASAIRLFLTEKGRSVAEAMALGAGFETLTPQEWIDG